MDRLTSMAAFVKAADVGSFAGAAVALQISPQMVAKHVTFLEERMGARLINRTTRRQSLTEIGRTYYERCKAVLAEADWADSLAGEAEAEPKGRLRINAPVSLGVSSIVPLVTRYMKRHPDVDVDLVLNDRMVDPVEEGFEATFRIGPLADSIMVARPLAPFRLVACASPAYLEARGTPLTPQEFVDHECLIYAHWPGPTSNEWVFRQGDRSWMVEHRRNRFQVNNPMGLLSAAHDGFGITLLSHQLVRESLESGRLVRLLANYEAPWRPINLMFFAARRQTSKLRSFIDFAVDELGPRRDAPPAVTWPPSLADETTPL